MAFTLEDAKQIGEDIGIDWEEVEFTPEDFLTGLEIELEHGTERGDEVNVTDDDPKLTGMIAWAHLMESPLYYDEEKGLPAFEKELEGAGEEEGAQEKSAAYDPHAEGYEIAKELIYGEEADKLVDVVRKYAERCSWAITRYGHLINTYTRNPRIPEDVSDEDRREIEALLDLQQKCSDLLLSLGKAEELYYEDEEEEDDEYGMERSEGATYRQGSIIHGGRVYIAKRRYKGPAIEKGKTSIGGGAAPAVKWLAKQGVFQPGMKVLDWGAGKVARNADYLRNMGCKVYAYDPFNATSGNGWEMGSVTDKKPRPQRFDVGFSSFVLNVVPEHVEDEILRDMGRYTDVMFHIVRNQDIYQMAYNALTGATNNPRIVNFFLNEFADDEEKAAWEAGDVYEEDILAFCQFGFESGKDKFQRIPSDLEEKGYRILKETSGYTIYSNA